MSELEEAIQFAKDVSKTIIESGEEHRPILIAVTSAGIGLCPLSPVKKDLWRQTITALLRQLNAYAYVFISEAWTAELPKDSLTTQKLLRGEIKVSELPPDDRIERLLIIAAENGKSIRSWAAKIRYTRESERYLDEWKEADKVGEGRVIITEW